jgi:hypothetical protein
MLGISIVKTKELARLRSIAESFNSTVWQKNEEIKRLKTQAGIWKSVAEKADMQAKKSVKAREEKKVCGKAAAKQAKSGTEKSNH